MRLTFSLCKHITRGHLFRGKDRLVKKVTKKEMDKLVSEYQIQEQNMLILRHPYLTVEESSGHMKDKNRRHEFLKTNIENNLKKSMKPHVKIEERLYHLRTKDAWD